MTIYQHFLLRIGTPQHETDSTFEFLLAPNRDLFIIKKSNTGTNSTEIHVLSAISNYQQYVDQMGTPLHETDSTFEFLLAPNRDLFIIRKSNTGTNSTEIHILSAASNYQQFIGQNGTPLHETDSTFAFLLAPNLDLFVIKKSNTETNSTEVHVLSAASNYEQFVLQTGTAQHETDSTFGFLLAPNLDLFVIKKDNTGTNSTEVHILSAASNYQQFVYQSGTVQHETNSAFAFLLAPNLDLFVIKKSNTGTNSTEVHIMAYEPLPLLTDIRGIATMDILPRNIAGQDLGVPSSLSLSLQAGFDGFRTSVQITNLSPIIISNSETKSSTTITMVGGGSGSFDKSSGILNISISLRVKTTQLIEILGTNRLIEIDTSEIDFNLTTESTQTTPRGMSAMGVRLNNANGALTVVGASTFKNGMLQGHDSTLIIRGAIIPIP